MDKENAKVYTELINRLEDVKDAIKKQNYGIAMEILCKPYTPFQVITHSELKESEGERIRKHLIKHFGIKSKEDWNGVPVKSILAWLKKQGEQKANVVVRRFLIGDTFIDKYNPTNVFTVTEYIENGIAYVDQSGERFTKYYDDSWDDYQLIEQKAADKVEPKFKVGDWVVRELDNTCYQIKSILNVTNNKYGYDLTSGGYISSQDANYYHLWTIQDAKDGDVLCDYCEGFDNPLIFILKKFERVDYGLVKPSDYSSYCFLTAGERQIFKEGKYHHKHNIKPADKEQRDTLMKAMAYAGLTFDFEKKELKKIE